MPKKEIAADRFIDSHPQFDSQGVVFAQFDSGVDPAADGLQVTSDGKPEILDVLDCTGSGDVDTSTIVKADADGCITGASGSSLVVNSSWKNPSGEWHVGYKFVYELFTSDLVSRLKKERKKKWNEKTQKEIALVVKQLDEFDKKNKKVDDANLKKAREVFENRFDILRKQVDRYDDKGPVIDAVVWHDGELWRVALDTQSFENDSESGKLADFTPLTNYREERKYGVFSKIDACTFVVNVYNEGNVMSIVTDSSPHGTHVAGITAAFHPMEPLLNGVAPGAQLISSKIGDTRLGSMETGTGLTQAVIADVQISTSIIGVRGKNKEFVVFGADSRACGARYGEALPKDYIKLRKVCGEFVGIGAGDSATIDGVFIEVGKESLKKPPQTVEELAALLAHVATEDTKLRRTSSPQEKKKIPPDYLIGGVKAGCCGMFTVSCFEVVDVNGKEEYQYRVGEPEIALLGHGDELMMEELVDLNIYPTMSASTPLEAKNFMKKAMHHAKRFDFGTDGKFRVVTFCSDGTMTCSTATPFDESPDSHFGAWVDNEFSPVTLKEEFRKLPIN